MRSGGGSVWRAVWAARGWKDKSRNNPIHLSKDVFFNWTEKNG